MKRFAWVALAAAPLCAAAPTNVTRFDCRVPFQAEYRASTFTASAQEQAAIAALPDGGSVVVWSSRRQNNGRYGVYLQRFDAQGQAIGAETAVGLLSTTHQASPDVAVDAAGNVWVAWQSHGQDGDAGTILMRRFDHDGLGGGEMLVNQSTVGHQSEPVLATSAGGTIAVAWNHLAGSDAAARCAVRLYDSSGHALSDEWMVSAPAGGAARTPSVSFAPDGSAALAFAAFDDQGRPAGIYTQCFDVAGTPRTAPVQIADAATNPIEPVLRSTPTGFALAWLDTESDGSDYGVVATRLDERAAPRGTRFVVNEATGGSQTAAAVTVGPSGDFVIAWNGPDGDRSGVFARAFDAQGAALGGEVALNSATRGQQRMRTAVATSRAALTRDGTLLCAWNGDGDRGDRNAVHVSARLPRMLPANLTPGVSAEMSPAAPPTLAAAGPQPHVPPTFDARRATHAPREVRRGLTEVGFTAIVDTGWTPPDPHLAVGPNHVGVMTNGAIAFFTKDGTLTFEDEIEDNFGFWGTVGATGFVFDPEIVYDPISERWFAMAAEAFANGRSYVLLATSDDSDPNGTWSRWRIRTREAGDLFDSPNIAVGDDIVYITGDAFPSGPPSYPVYLFDKATMLAGGALSIGQTILLSTSTQSAGIPPVSFDSPPGLYMAEHSEAAAPNTVRLISITGAIGSAVVDETTLTVPAYTAPEDAPQLGTSSRPESFDNRFWRVAYRNGSLWATHHQGSARVLARWYEFAMNGWPTSGNLPALVQSGDVDLGAGIRTFFTAITVDDGGNAALTFARSSPSEFISMASAHRLSCDALGTMGNAATWQTATAGYSAGRWGDYAAVEVDPADGRTFWAHHEYAIGASWRTWVQSFGGDFADCNANNVADSCDIATGTSLDADGNGVPDECEGVPCPGDFDGDNDVDLGDLGVVLANFGLSGPGIGGDLDGDDDVDLSDLGEFLTLFGQPCP